MIWSCSGWKTPLGVPVTRTEGGTLFHRPPSSICSTRSGGDSSTIQHEHRDSHSIHYPTGNREDTIEFEGLGGGQLSSPAVKGFTRLATPQAPPLAAMDDAFTDAGRADRGHGRRRVPNNTLVVSLRGALDAATQLGDRSPHAHRQIYTSATGLKALHLNLLHPYSQLPY